MQKPTNRILSALLALIMVLSMLPATVFAASETDALEGWSITLGDNIGVKFHLNSADYTVTTTVNGVEVNPTISDNVATVNVAAAQMNDTIALTVKSGEETVHTGEYSVRQYAETILNGEYDAEVKEMVLQMLNYGAAAQTYFNYNTENLANADHELETAATVPTEVPEITVEDNLAGISLYGMSLVFQSKTAVRFYFNVSGDIADYTFSQGTPVEKDDMYYVEISDINPQDLDKTITMEVSKGEEKLTVSYSPLSYIVRKYNNSESSDNLKALVQAMYGYHLEALEYQEYLQIIQVGTLQQHSNNTPWVKNDNETFIYFNTDAYTATTGEYTSLTADAIKLVRGGEVYSVANPGQGLLVKDNDTQHLLKLTPWGMTGGHLPIQAHDYFIIEGRFVSTSGDGTTIQIAKSYIYFDGTNVEVSATEPILPTTVEGGLMQTHSNSHGDYGIYFKMDANDAPYNTDWSLEYTQTSVDNIKLIRDGETISIGIVDRPLIIKYGETDYYLKLEGWNVGDYGMNGQSSPITTEDILIIEGGFQYTAEKVTLNITKSYVYYNGSAWVCSADEPVLDTTVDVVSLSSHSNGWNSTSAENPGGMTFTAAENDAPYLTDWSLRYTPVSSDVIKLIRDGVETSIANTGAETIIKYSATEYYLEFWPFSQKPMLAGDEIIIEGLFYNAANKTYIDVEKTYIILNADNSVTVITGGYINAGHLSDHSNGINGTDGIYATMTANSAPYDSWSIEYAPLTDDAYYVIRDGETINIGNPGRGTLVKYSDTEYYLKLTQWCTDNFAFTTDDIFVIDGFWKQNTNGNAVMKIEKTYLYYNGSAWTFSTTEPAPSTTVDCGTMSEHTDGSVSEIYFSMADNSVPVDENAEIAYAGTVQLVSDGNTSSESANIYKLDEGYYYLELDGVELTDGDYLIVEGAFSNADNGYILNITKTYVLVDGDTLVYSTTEPVVETVIEIGTMSSAPQYGTSGVDFSNGVIGNIYGTTEANEAPFDGWNYEYAPVSAENLKLIRDGVTYNVGVPGSGTVVKFNETAYCVKAYAWTVSGSKLPLVPGDILVVEGKYNQTSDSSVVVNFAPTYILVTSETTVKLMSAMPNLISGGTMSEHTNARTANGFYAKTAANSAPYDSSWSLRYKPLATDVVKFVSGDTTTNVANTGGEMLVKYSDTEYFFEGWTLSGTFANAVGNTYIINGLFYNEANDAYIDIDTTYVMITDSDEMFYHIEAGMMASNEKGTGGDGIYVTLPANSAPVNGWLTEFAPASADVYKIIRNGETLSIGISGRGTLVKVGDTDYYLKTSGWCLNGEAVTTDDIIIVEGIFVGTSNNADAEGIAMYISKTYIYYDGTAWAFSETEPAQKTIVDVVELGSHSNGWNANELYFTAQANAAPYNSDWSLRYIPESADAIKLIHDGNTTNVGNTGAETIGKYSETEYFIAGWAVGLSNVVAGDQMIIEGRFYNAANDVYIDIEKTYITFNEGGTTTVISESSKYINAGAMSANNGANWFGDGIYFALSSNAAPAAESWAVRYVPKNAANIKLIRNGETFNIANTGAETIVKIADGYYWLGLDWWLGNYAPIVDGDVLVIEGEFANASNGYTLNIDKTYITFISKENDDVVFSVAADTEFGEVLLPNSADTLTIGMWNGSYHVFEDKQLQELQAAGITKIMGINTLYIGNDTDGDGSISDAEVSSWLDRVYSYGISVIFDLRSWDGETVPSYVDHPGVIGFLMFDEPCATDFDTLAELKTKFDAVMPEGTLFYVNLFPSCAAGTSLVGAADWALGRRDYDQYYVQKFLDKLDIEVLSWDNYSLLEGSGIRTDYFYNFEVMASKNVPMWYTMLSSGHDTTSTSYATPTEAELRWQMAVAMTYGVQNIDHYTYVSHESNYSCMVEYETWEPTDLYYDILKVDNEYLAWDNIFMAYDWVGVSGIKAGTSSTMLDKLQNNIDLTANGLEAVSATQDVLVGVFDYNGDKAYMVTNAGSAGSGTVGDGMSFTMADGTVTLTLADGDYKCAAVIDNGEITYVAVENNTVTLNVEAYEGVFVIPVLN